MNIMLSPKIERLIKEFNPSVIVCTHPFPSNGFLFKKENKISTPAVAILTDYVNHPLWFHKNIEAFIVGHDYIKEDMIRCGIPKRNYIFIRGTCFTNFFREKGKVSSARKELSLEDKFTVLIMGGSLGYGNLESAFIDFGNVLGKCS